jgi:hypothetical protein
MSRRRELGGYEERPNRRQKVEDLSASSLLSALSQLYTSVIIPDPLPRRTVMSDPTPFSTKSISSGPMSYKTYKEVLMKMEAQQEKPISPFKLKNKAETDSSGGILDLFPKRPRILDRTKSDSRNSIARTRAQKVVVDDVDKDLNDAIQEIDDLKIGTRARPSFKIVTPNKPKALDIMEIKNREQISKVVYSKLVEQSLDRLIKIQAKTSLPISSDQLDLYQMVTSRRVPGGQVLIHKFGVEITAELASCLKDGTWLNDEVINFFLELLSERSQKRLEKDPSHPKCIFLNSFFYTKLSENGYNYNGVKRWTKRRKIDIFACDLVFFPVNQSNVHWTLGVINVAEQTIEFFDSMGGRGGSYFSIMSRYLVDEYRDKKNADLDIDEWSQHCPHDIPHQANGYDCGMFVCKFADFRSDDLPLAFSQQHLKYFRRRIFAEICAGHII